MNIFKNGNRIVPLILQTETTECGLACVAMVASYYGLKTDLNSLRQKFGTSLKGNTLHDIVEFANDLDLSPRPLKASLRHLASIKLPAILHWRFTHFVVLTEISKKLATINDPSAGIKNISIEELSTSFTGVVLELSPSASFVPRTERIVVTFSTLLGKLYGLKRLLFESFTVACMLEVLSLTAPLFIQLIFDKALISQDQSLVATLAIGFLILGLFQVALSTIRSWLLVHLGTSINLQLANNLFRHLLTLPLDFFHKRNVGDIISRFDSLTTIQRTLTGNFLESLFDGVMAIITIVVMFFYSSLLASIVLIVSVIYACLRIALYRPYRNASEEQLANAAKLQGHFLETLRGMQSIKLFNKESLRRIHWQNLAIETYNSIIRINKIGILYQGINTALFTAENVIVVAVGAILVIDGKISAGMLVAFLAYKLIFVTRISALIARIMDFKLLNLHKERVSDIALTPSETNVFPPDSGSVTGAPLLELKNICFKYSKNEPFVLDNVCLSLTDGESLVIVGPSGCGKTTLLKIMLGLVEATSGSILVRGVPIETIGPRRFRDEIGTVMQDETLFSGTISENISFFDPDIDQKHVEACASVACIANDITMMPMSYRTFVGDMGGALSGGQRQRILLARALYKRPTLLVLDEATSHLDVALERRLSEAIQSLKITRIMVAHRAETIATATRIFSLL